MKEKDNEEREYASSRVIHLSDEDREPWIIETPAFKYNLIVFDLMKVLLVS